MSLTNISSLQLLGIPLEEDAYVISDLLASLTQGFVGGDLANIVNEAPLLAARRGADVVTREDMMEAIERAKFEMKDRKSAPSALSHELAKLFPWMPSLVSKSDEYYT
ncbi:metalloprotease [Lithospermum erythrorhizon]|uniref:Metalloprotease n=1 Tax=Lithospermum erythrorhizon TaxID=34254 RepID=A0AAV3P8M3_LITER